jgi:hypothetical protein
LGLFFQTYRQASREAFIQVFSGNQVVVGRAGYEPARIKNAQKHGSNLSSVLAHQQAIEKIVRRTQKIWLHVWQREALPPNTSHCLLSLALVKHSLTFARASEEVRDEFHRSFSVPVQVQLDEVLKVTASWFPSQISARACQEMQQFSQSPETSVELFRFIYHYLSLDQQLNRSCLESFAAAGQTHFS